MNKKLLIALADAIRDHNRFAQQCNGDVFTGPQIARLADFCAAQNPAFKRERWMDYIAGKCSANGGAARQSGPMSETSVTLTKLTDALLTCKDVIAHARHFYSGSHSLKNFTMAIEQADAALRAVNKVSGAVKGGAVK